MDSKRKANGNAAAEPDDRSSKRRKLAEFDLSKGETRQSTTAYGLSFMEQIRRTADKSGRLVATYFEKLLPRKGNEEYYKRTRMPIALETIEQKLNKGDFQNLAQLESYFKRMICNAKEFYPRSSSTYEDAERVRKALSNYMTKTNPAYGTRGYQAHPTPLPPEDASQDEENDTDAQDKQEEQETQAPAQADKAHDPQTQESGDQAPDKPDDDHEDDQEQNEDAQGDEEVDEAADKQDDSMTSGRSSRRRSIVLKRRGSSRIPKTQAAQARESPRRSVVPARPDHQYFNVPYKDLNFQQAQEKAVEEMLRYTKSDIEGYFEPFQNLPPRSLKDYYKVIDDPMSLKKLQKMVKGIHGRNGATGVSVFKGWSAMAEKAKLLWTNAMYYNEEGSEIFELALELQKAFEDELKRAQLAVPEPAQPKIKLKVGQPEPPTGKKITIHVGGRGGSADSPAPQTAPQPPPPPAETPAPGVNGSTRTSSRLEAARSFSGSVPSPSPSRQIARSSTGPRPDETALHMAPVTPVSVQPPAMAPVVAQSARMLAPAMHPQPVPPMAMHPQAQPAMAMTNGYVEHRRLRRPGKGFNDALMSRLRIQLHPSIQADRRDVAVVHPSPVEPYQSTTVNLPAHHSRVFVVLMLPDFLWDREYSLWVLVDRQPLKPCMHPLPNQLPQERTFELMLRPGVNVIEAHLVAAVPAPERVPGGPEVDLEVFTVFTNLMRP